MQIAIKSEKGSKTVLVALSLLDWFTQERLEISLSEFVRLSKMPKANVFRYLTAIERSGLIKQNVNTKKYQLGFKSLELAYLVNKQFNLRDLALIYMERIREKTNETVCLQVEDNGKGVTIERLESKNKLVYLPPIGSRELLHAGASRKVLLAFLPEERVKEIIAEGLPALTLRTITDANQLKHEIKQIRDLGYAISTGEHVDGVTAISVPIKDRFGSTVASLSVVGPTFRISQEKQQYCLACLLEAANEFSKELGYRV